MKESENMPQVFEDDSIDLIALLRQLYLSRWLIVKVSAVAALLGVAVALATPNTYTSGVTFITQTGSSKGASSSLSGLAALAGLNFDGAGVGSDIPTGLYPQIVSSVPFKRKLLKGQISFENKELTVGDYLSLEQKASLISEIIKYTIGLPKLILSTEYGQGNKTINKKDKQIDIISQEDKYLFEKLKNNLHLSVNSKEGFLKLEFSDKDKFVAAQIAQLSMTILQDLIIDFKNQTAREILNYTTRQYFDNKSKYETLQDSLAIFKDQNLNISSSLYKNRVDRLERELRISSSVVEQLASQLEQAKLQVKKDTPVFTIIEPVIIPVDRSSPNRKIKVLSSLFLGFLFSSAYVLLRDFFKKYLLMIKGAKE